MKNTWIQVRISEEEKEVLTKLSEKLDKPVSQIVRESVREAVEASEKPDPQELAVAS